MNACTTCGSNLPERATVCPWCGETTPDGIARGVPPGAGVTPPRSKNQMGIGLAIGLGVGIVLLWLAFFALAALSTHGFQVAWAVLIASLAIPIVLLVASYTPAAPDTLRSKRRLLVGITIGFVLPYAVVGGLVWMCVGAFSGGMH